MTRWPGNLKIGKQMHNNIYDTYYCHTFGWETATPCFVFCSYFPLYGTLFKIWTYIIRSQYLLKEIRMKHLQWCPEPFNGLSLVQSETHWWWRLLAHSWSEESHVWKNCGGKSCSKNRTEAWRGLSRRTPFKNLISQVKWLLNQKPHQQSLTWGKDFLLISDKTDKNYPLAHCP